jgi:glycerophosphoryl diester phosphodiesterase
MKHRGKFIIKICIIFPFIFLIYGCSINQNINRNNSARSIEVLNEVSGPRLIAHRGYWAADGSDQNSIKSLRLAAELGVYGSEFDVHLTADDIPVVYHDNIIKGTNINIQQVSYNAIKDVVLSNGEKLPTLNDYLEAGKTLSIQLILELKPHATPERDRKAAQIIVDRVKYYGLENRVDYITFSLEAGKELIRLQPNGNVGYLNGNLTPAELKGYGFSTLSYYFEVIGSHPEYLVEARELGLNRVVWTVNDLSLMERLINQGVNFITTDIPLQAKEYLELKARQ